MKYCFVAEDDDESEEAAATGGAFDKLIMLTHCNWNIVL